MTETTKKKFIFYKCQQIPVPYVSMLHISPSRLLLLPAAQEPYKKPTSSLKILKNFWDKSQENGPAGRKKDKTERVTGFGRRARKQMVKWNQMTALRF